MNARFPATVATLEEATAYYQNRATQLLHLGWELDDFCPMHGETAFVALQATFTAPEGTHPHWRTHRSVFVFEGHTGKGILTRWLETNRVPFVASDACPKMQAWLDKHDIDYTNIEVPKSRAYQAVERFYAGGQARRSGVFFMNHIDEGLDILVRLGASQETKDAWCLHPLLQRDEDLYATLDSRLSGQSPAALVLAMEYRQQANAHLSFHEPKVPTWGLLDEIKQMLIADKMQNRKDFEKHLRGHADVPNSDRLDAYFKEWFDALGITDTAYQKWVVSVTYRTGGSLW